MNVFKHSHKSVHIGNQTDIRPSYETTPKPFESSRRQLSNGVVDRFIRGLVGKILQIEHHFSDFPKGPERFNNFITTIRPKLDHSICPAFWGVWKRNLSHWKALVVSFRTVPVSYHISWKRVRYRTVEFRSDRRYEVFLCVFLKRFMIFWKPDN